MPCDFVLDSDEHGEFCIIPLSEKGTKNVRFFTQIDVADFEDTSKDKWSVWVSKDCKTKYAFRNTPRVNGKRPKIWLHRQILGVKSNKILADHRDGNGLNNRRYNLRVATNAQNQWNSQSKTGKSQYKGVSWHKPREKWCAKIMYLRKQIWLGLFSSEIEAAKAYDEAARKYFGTFACLNFPEKEMTVYKISKKDEKKAIKLIAECKAETVTDTSEILSNKSVAELEIMCNYLGCNISQLAGKIVGGLLG